jgi:hypothetical protein
MLQDALGAAVGHPVESEFGAKSNESRFSLDGNGSPRPDSDHVWSESGLDSRFGRIFCGKPVGHFS